jgi:hypothetical protein
MRDNGLPVRVRLPKRRLGTTTGQRDDSLWAYDAV